MLVWNLLVNLGYGIVLKTHMYIKLPRLHVRFRNKLVFYGEELLAPRPTPKLGDHPLSAVRDCLFNIFAATLHTWRVFPPSATWGRAMLWWQGTHLTWSDTHRKPIMSITAVLLPFVTYLLTFPCICTCDLTRKAHQMMAVIWFPIGLVPSVILITPFLLQCRLVT
jgi:hypothetical protein